MIVEQARWGDLGVGSYVIGEDGQAWRVLQAAQGWLQAESTNGRVVAVPPRDSNALVSVLTPTMAEAIATMRVTLGATVVDTETTVP